MTEVEETYISGRLQGLMEARLIVVEVLGVTPDQHLLDAELAAFSASIQTSCSRQERDDIQGDD